MIVETNRTMENFRNVSWKQWLDFRLGTSSLSKISKNRLLSATTFLSKVLSTYLYSSGPRSGSVWWFWSGTETRVCRSDIAVKRLQNLKKAFKFDRKSALSLDFLFRQMTTRNSKSFTYLLIFWRWHSASWHSIDVINNKSAKVSLTDELKINNCKL